MSLTRRTFIQRIAQTSGYAAAFSTMHTLGLLAEVGQSTLPHLAPDFGKGRKVVILGAGIAGLVSAYELRKAGFDCTILEARSRPGGRNWSIRDGSKVEFTDGTVQQCDWHDGGYLNAGPARLPSIHTHMLGYCEELGVPLEVEVNTSRSALMQSPALCNGAPVTQRRVVHDTRGYIAELLSKAINQNALDQQLTKTEAAQMIDFLRGYGDLDPTGKYTGTTRAGFTTWPGAGPAAAITNQPLPLHELLAADLSRGELYEEQIDWQATMFQPIGGMDRIPYAFAKSLGSLIHYDSPVTEILTGDRTVTIAWTRAGAPQTLTADFCICTMPIAVLAKTKNNFSPEANKAFTGMPMTALYKIAWESPRFWEKQSNIYGGISFLKAPVDTVWYPSATMFSKTGVLISGFSLEHNTAGVPTAFGALGTTEAKLAASRNAVDILHPGCGSSLTKPIYVNWFQIPWSLGGFANNMPPASAPAYAQLEKPEGNTWFAGDYLSHLVGWQEGAALSAHHAIDRIARRMKTP